MVKFFGSGAASGGAAKLVKPKKAVMHRDWKLDRPQVERKALWKSFCESERQAELSKLDAEKDEIKAIRSLKGKWIGGAAGRTGDSWAALKHYDKLAFARAESAAPSHQLKSSKLASRQTKRTARLGDKKKRGQRGKGNVIVFSSSVRQASLFAHSNLPKIFAFGAKLVKGGARGGSGRVAETGSFVRLCIIAQVINLPRSSVKGGGLDPQVGAMSEHAVRTYIWASQPDPGNNTECDEALKCVTTARKHMVHLKDDPTKKCDCKAPITFMTSADDVAKAFAQRKRRKRNQDPTAEGHAAGLFSASASASSSSSGGGHSLEGNT